MAWGHGYYQYYYDSHTRFLYATKDEAKRLGDYEFYNNDEDFEGKDVYLIADGDSPAVIILDDIRYGSELVSQVI